VIFVTFFFKLNKVVVLICAVQFCNLQILQDFLQKFISTGSDISPHVLKSLHNTFGNHLNDHFITYLNNILDVNYICHGLWCSKHIHSEELSLTYAFCAPHSSFCG
ncbi:hypothetical protein EDC04DRAFT_2766608, partial [Pisolithus marmoratus]